MLWWACRTLWVINTAALYAGDWERSLDTAGAASPMGRPPMTRG